MVLSFDSSAPKPKFNSSAKLCEIEYKNGFVIAYSNQCPFCEDYVSQIKEEAILKGIPLKIIKYKSAEEAQKSPVVSTTYSIFKNGEFITHSILTVDKFMKLLE
ncbi:YoaP domain-containing protein [Clostridium tetani]|uniref:RAS-like protein n=1 Tax=Clostridium tetani (strain Massachusetts / E88) TaxID=212717 RepID=Q892E3_CLOTE|nr:YoaP domain-containing protein [Clostridium tetani]AAO36652.1 RAS-like protein [Clostridium tetani E88]QBD85515.1 hypothetical protein EQG73_10160 [Clostridium tetani]QBD87870.1 hypothetical protein EW636_10155 [Clostridium tetani]RXI60132.1 hypothetical protein DP132_11600 [Clostridium tetani]RXI61015.1 hypothetical protein DP125_05945 [Clostridium tetani]